MIFYFFFFISTDATGVEFFVVFLILHRISGGINNATVNKKKKVFIISVIIYHLRISKPKCYLLHYLLSDLFIHWRVHHFREIKVQSKVLFLMIFQMSFFFIFSFTMFKKLFLWNSFEKKNFLRFCIIYFMLKNVHFIPVALFHSSIFRFLLFFF